MKCTLLLLMLFSFRIIGTAQQNSDIARAPGRSSFYVELGGPGILFSANIDHRFTNSRLGWGGRFGIGFITTDDESYDPASGYNTYRDISVITVPLQVNYIFGKATSLHTFEVGGGATLLSRRVDLFSLTNTRKTALVGTTSFMYRRQPVDGGFTWRIGLTPLVVSSYVQLSGAVGVGYNF